MPLACTVCQSNVPRADCDQHECQQALIRNLNDIDGARTLFSLFEDLRVEEAKTQAQRQDDIMAAMRDEKDTFSKRFSDN